MSSGASDASDAIEDANGSAKELRKTLLGIDELNVMPDTSSSGSTDLGGGGGFDFELPEYDFTKALSESRVAQIVEEMKEWLGLTEDIDSWSDLFDTKLGTIISDVATIGAGFAAWKISQSVLTVIDKLKGMKGFSLPEGFVGLAGLLSDLNEFSKYFEDFGTNGATFHNISGMISEFGGSYANLGNPYPLFPSVTVTTPYAKNLPTATKTDTTTKVMYWTRQVKHLGTLVACAAGTDGIESTVQGTNLTSTACYVRFGFCI